MKKFLYKHIADDLVTRIATCMLLLTSTAPLIAAGDGTMKVIAVANANVAPIKIHTNRGSFLVDGLNQPTAGLIYSKDHWKAAIGNVTWFVDTQQGATLTQSSATALVNLRNPRPVGVVIDQGLLQ